MTSADSDILASWHRNAPRWLSAIRDAAIPVRFLQELEAKDDNSIPKLINCFLSIQIKWERSKK